MLCGQLEGFDLVLFLIIILISSGFLLQFLLSLDLVNDLVE